MVAAPGKMQRQAWDLPPVNWGDSITVHNVSSFTGNSMSNYGMKGRLPMHSRIDFSSIKQQFRKVQQSHEVVTWQNRPAAASKSALSLLVQAENSPSVETKGRSQIQPSLPET